MPTRVRWDYTATLALHDLCCEEHRGTRNRCKEKLHTRGTYVNGCRCDQCRAAERAYKAEYRARKARVAS